MEEGGEAGVDDIHLGKGNGGREGGREGGRKGYMGSRLVKQGPARAGREEGRKGGMDGWMDGGRGNKMTKQEEYKPSAAHPSLPPSLPPPLPACNSTRLPPRKPWRPSAHTAPGACE